jgi:small-conductance mechanosensitive channel
MLESTPNNQGIHPPEKQSPPEHQGKDIVEIINEVNPKKLNEIMQAIVTPFQEGPTRERRFILILILIVLIIIIVSIFILAALGKVDGGVAIFALGTAFGYIFGFLSKLFINE